jgi:hypothetical protein
MIPPAQHEALAEQVQSALAPRIPDVAVRIGPDIHYDGLNVVITAPAFQGLLPEQRFHHVARNLPADLYEQLRGRVVWFELAPGESAQSVMKMPRSEDIAAGESDILKRLTAERFFKKLEKSILTARKGASQWDFVEAKRLLADAGWSPDDVTRACLFFIRHGGVCDAHILTHVMEQLAGSHADDDDGPPARAGKSRAAKL